VLIGGKGSTDVVEWVWPRNMAGLPRGGFLAVLYLGIVATKSRNRPMDSINTPLLSPLEYTHTLK
jgi:hypothetical protein